MHLFLAAEITGLPFIVNSSSSAFSTIAKFHEILTDTLLSAKASFAAWKASPQPPPRDPRPSTDPRNTPTPFPRVAWNASCCHAAASAVNICDLEKWPLATPGQT